MFRMPPGRKEDATISKTQMRREEIILPNTVTDELSWIKLLYPPKNPKRNLSFERAFMPRQDG